MASERPKVCYILPRYDPATGTHFFHLYELINRAAGLLDIFLVIEQPSAPAGDPGVPVYCQRFSFPPLRFFELLFVLARARMRGCRNFYTHYSFYGGAASWIITRLFGGRAYYWNCGMPWLYRRPWITERVFRFILRNTILVTGTPGIADAYSRHYGIDRQRIRILPNWVNTERFRDALTKEEARSRLGIAPEAKVVLFVHWLSRRKGAHLLPEIIRQVTGKDRNVMFLIVGTGPEERNLKLKIENCLPAEALAEAGKFENFVRLVGEVPHRDIPAYYRAADIFFMPSEEEGFPHVLLEAMATGIPYVASDVGGVREITPPALHSYLVPSGAPRLFTEKILELLTKPAADIAEIANREQAWAAKYGTETILPRFHGLFEHPAEPSMMPVRKP